MWIKVGIVGACFLLLLSTLLGLIIGPVNFFAYIVYAIGWVMSGHGIRVFWDFKINASYCYALYPLAYYAHRLAWKIYISIIDWAPGVKSFQINNIYSRIVTFIPFAFFFSGLWYATGWFLRWFALENSSINEQYFIDFGHMIQDYPWVFQILFTSMVILSYVFVILKLMIALKHEDAVESMIR